MATEHQFMLTVHDQLGMGSELSYRKMFGEYALYHDSKVIGFVCDNEVFIKRTDDGEELLKTAGMEYQLDQPYPKAKLYLLVTHLLEKREQLVGLIRMTAEIVPPPEPKSKRPKKTRLKNS